VFELKDAKLEDRLSSSILGKKERERDGGGMYMYVVKEGCVLVNGACIDTKNSTFTFLFFQMSKTVNTPIRPHTKCTHVPFIQQFQESE
jgi:hypothetical protein